MEEEKRKYLNVYNEYFTICERKVRELKLDAECNCKIEHRYICDCKEPHIKCIEVNDEKFCEQCDKWLCRCDETNKTNDDINKNKKIYGKYREEQQIKHISKLNECLKEIDNFLQKDQNENIEIAAEDLRLATRHLGAVVGKVDVEEILGSIFKDFCIGK